MMWRSVGLLGRDPLLEQLLPRALGKKPEFLLVGSRGSGKTALLSWSYQQARQHGQKAALVSCAQTVKEIFTEVCVAWEIAIFRGDKQVQPHQVSLGVLELAIMAQADGMIFIDDIHQATPAFLRRLKVWRERFTIYAAGVSSELTKEELKRCLFGLKTIDVPPLTDEHRLMLARAVCIHIGSTKSPSEIAKASGGMPARIVAMAQGEIEMSSPRVKGEELNLSPVFLMLGGLAVGLRYLGSGLNQTDLYLLGGLGMAIFICLRYVLLPGMSRG